MDHGRHPDQSIGQLGAPGHSVGNVGVADLALVGGGEQRRLGGAQRRGTRRRRIRSPPLPQAPGSHWNGRTSTAARQAAEPCAARASATSRSGASTIQNPLSDSLVSANGPSVVVTAPALLPPSPRAARRGIGRRTEFLDVMCITSGRAGRSRSVPDADLDQACSDGACRVRVLRPGRCSGTGSPGTDLPSQGLLRRAGHRAGVEPRRARPIGNATPPDGCATASSPACRVRYCDWSLGR